MKQFCTLLIFIFSSFYHVTAQSNTDSTHYLIKNYQVKKKREKVREIARQFNIDPSFISSFNDSINIDSFLAKGTVIKVPVPITDNFENAVIGTKRDSAANLTEISKIQADTSVIGMVRSDSISQFASSIKVDTFTAKSSLTLPTVRPYNTGIDTDLLLSKIMLSEAMLDLNKGLLQGINASLDSFKIKDKSGLDEKNMAATIHKMQRARDKALLTPFLLHMRDSLNIEIKKEEDEKSSFETMLYAPASAGYNPPVKVVKEPVIAETGKADSLAKPVAIMQPSVIQPASVTLPPPAKKDTVAVLQTQVFLSAEVPKSKPNKKQPKHVKATEVVATGKIDSSAFVSGMPSTNHVIESPVSSKPFVSQINHWETAKALYYTDDSSAREKKSNEMAGYDGDLQQVKVGDTSGYIPSKTPSDNMPGMSDSVRVIRAQLFLTKAMKASNEKNYRTASEDLKRSIDLNPHFYEAWFALGEVEAHLGLYTKALNELKTCATIDSSKAVLYYKMGNIQLKLRQLTEAFANFNKSLARDSNYVPAIMGRASVYVDRKQYKTAVAEYSKALQIDRGYHTAYRAKAMAEYLLKSYDAAIDDFTRFLIFDETDASVYYYRGLSKISLNQLMEACTDLSVSAKLGYSAALKALDANCK